MPVSMKVTATVFGLCFLALGTAGVSAGDSNRVITKNLVLNNGLNFGKWGDIEYCFDDSYVYGIEAMFEPYALLHIDETAVNTVKLYCEDIFGQRTGYITSRVGERGDWQGERSCPHGLMTGMRALVLEYQGTTTDDVAVQNVEIQCDYGESTVLAVDEQLVNKVVPGNWSEWSTCDYDSAVCGIMVRYEQPFLVEDTMAISDISMYCCSV